MAGIIVTVTVEGEQLDVAALVQDQLDSELRFRTVGPSCAECLAAEELSEAGGGVAQAPPLHKDCDCILVLVSDEDGP